MKLYMKSLTLLLFLGTVASCNDSFLDQTQTSDLNRETVFADSTYTANFLTGIYTDIGFDINYNRWTYLLANGGGLQSACDEAEFYPSSTIWTNMMFATGTVNPVTVSDDAWSKCYTNIRRCNVFLANIDRSPMVQSRKAQYISEALFLRAWYYFILISLPLSEPRTALRSQTFSTPVMVLTKADGVNSPSTFFSSSSV